MSVILSSHNLAQIEWLNFELSTHCYALRLLDDVEEHKRNDEWHRLLHERISVISDVVFSFKCLETCIRNGSEWNYDPDSSYSSADLASVEYFHDKNKTDKEVTK